MADLRSPRRVRVSPARRSASAAPAARAPMPTPSRSHRPASSRRQAWDRTASWRNRLAAAAAMVASRSRAPARENGALSLAMGGAGGSGGAAGLASVDSTGNITTGGAQAAGIVAQSIGGGGGNGGFAVSGTLTIGTGGSASFSFGGGGGSRREGRCVFTSAAPATSLTSGPGSSGILAQSIGGCGGNGGFSGSVALGQWCRDCECGRRQRRLMHGRRPVQFGGAVDVTSIGNITTTKDNSMGFTPSRSAAAVAMAASRWPLRRRWTTTPSARRRRHRRYWRHRWYRECRPAWRGSHERHAINRHLRAIARWRRWQRWLCDWSLAVLQRFDGSEFRRRQRR